ncbi:MAG: SAM-dependent methyltransferase [Chloroflexi bacterium]|nr:SAM-dependent methyltransferase [Chloroflexota bacterium]
MEVAYLAEDDPIRQSGFGGGPERWRLEREPILEAVQGDGDFLDIGCANGHLLECLAGWGRERDLTLIPYGLDQGSRLIALAKQRLPRFASNLYVGNGWDWKPPRRFRYVYTIHDCVPSDFLEEYLKRLYRQVVGPEGRLIVGAYGSRSRGIAPFDIGGFLSSVGFTVAGEATGGEPPVAKFAWVDA